MIEIRRAWDGKHWQWIKHDEQKASYFWYGTAEGAMQAAWLRWGGSVPCLVFV
jgi:hypothetical protein